MNRSFRISLGPFLILALLACVLVSLVAHRILNRPIEIRQTVLGRVTSTANDFDNSLTLSELKWSAQITLHETTTEPPREIPLLGSAKLVKNIYLCRVAAIRKDGEPTYMNLRVEKNHFHLLEPSTQLFPTEFDRD